MKTANCNYLRVVNEPWPSTTQGTLKKMFNDFQTTTTTYPWPYTPTPPGTTPEPSNDACPHCSGAFSQVFHGGRCPQVKSIEYYPNGSIKKVEFNNETT